MIDLLGGVVLVWSFGVIILGLAWAIAMQAWPDWTWRDFFATWVRVVGWPVWLVWTLGTAVARRL